MGSAGSGEDLVDPFVEVGQHVVIQARVAIDHLLDLGERLVVVGGGIDADPVLTEVRADDLLGQERLADVGPEVCDAGDRPEVLTRRGDDPPLLRSEVPGFVIQCIRKSRSLNSGSNASPRCGTTNSPARKITIPTLAYAAAAREGSASGAR